MLKKFLDMFGSKAVEVIAPTTPEHSQFSADDVLFDVFTGSKYSGGMDPVNLSEIDYYTLRARSREIFERTPYAKGLINAIVNSKISTGLTVETQMPTSVVSPPEDLSEQIEELFTLWAGDPRLCDYSEQNSFSQIQQEVERNALLDGDCLVVLHTDPKTRMLQTQIVSAASIATPFNIKVAKGNRIEHGVELDSRGRHVAYHVKQRDGSFKRVSVYGRKSGRRTAILVYAHNGKRVNKSRGVPLLGVVMQSIQELDHYRESQLRTAVINSFLALWVEKSEDRPGSKPMTGGIIERKTVTGVSSSTTETKDRNIYGLSPGTVFDELDYGEKIRTHQGNTSVEGYQTFEKAIVDALAWAERFPPEILQLSFNSNYSASQAAKNEFVQTLKIWRLGTATAFCKPVYTEWLVQMARLRIVDMPLMLMAISAGRVLESAAWVASEWIAPIVPTVDILKNAKAYIELLDNSLITYEQAIKELTGSKALAVFKKLSQEKKLLKDLGLVSISEADDGEDTEDIDGKKDDNND